MTRRAKTVSRGDDPDNYPLPADSVPEPPDPEDVAAYIADIADELAKMAANSELETICYLLTLARLEAEAASRRNANTD